MTWNTCPWNALDWNDTECEDIGIARCGFRAVTLPPRPTGTPGSQVPPGISIVGLPPPPTPIWRPPDVKC